MLDPRGWRLGAGERAGRQAKSGAVAVEDARPRGDRDSHSIVLDREHLPRSCAGLEVTYEGLVDHGARADHEAKRRVVGRNEGRHRRHLQADAAIVRQTRFTDERATLQAGPLQDEHGPYEERYARDGPDAPGVGEHDRLADGSAVHSPRRGRISRSACATSSGKSISVHGRPSIRS